MKNTITILVAIIGAIATIAASIISAGNYAEDKTTNTLKLESAYAPVGTIVSSMLEPTEFARHMNETEGDELAKRKWVLADGRKVTGTEYARATKDKPLPDLRGVFLRGVDTGRTDDQGDPEKNRLAGTYQPDQLKSHSHEIEMRALAFRDQVSPNQDLDPGTWAAFTKIQTKPFGGPETRPRNVSVYFYIKIN